MGRCSLVACEQLARWLFGSCLEAFCKFTVQGRRRSPLTASTTRPCLALFIVYRHYALLTFRPSISASASRTVNGCRAVSPSSLLACSYSHGLQFTSLSRSPEFSSHHLGRFLSGAATSITPAHAGTTQHLNMAVALLAFINGSQDATHNICPFATAISLPLPFFRPPSSLTGELPNTTTQITPGHTRAHTHTYTRTPSPAPPLALRNQQDGSVSVQQPHRIASDALFITRPGKPCLPTSSLHNPTPPSFR